MTPDTTPIASVTIERIRKVLARAKDQEGTPEGETAARIATNLMTQHAITMADLAVADRAASDPLISERFDIGARSQWRRDVMFALCTHCTIRAVFYFGTSDMQLYGHVHDVEVAKYLYTIVLRQIEKAADVYVEGSLRGYTASEKRAERHSFTASAVRGLHVKLREIRDAAAKPSASGESAAQTESTPADSSLPTQSAGSTALVLQARKERVEEFYKARAGRVRSATIRRTGHSDAGYNAGRNVSLNAGLSTSAHRQVR